MRLLCGFLGHKWHSGTDPVCLRCGRAFADLCPGPAGRVYLGWGRYGYITPEPGTGENG